LHWVQLGRIPYDERPAPVHRLGDILRMLQVPEIERRLAPETVDCLQIMRRGTDEPFQELADAEILLLGDSFLRVFQQDAPGSAGFAAHLAKELGQSVQVLVNDAADPPWCAANSPPVPPISRKKGGVMGVCRTRPRTRSRGLAAGRPAATVASTRATSPSLPPPRQSDSGPMEGPLYRTDRTYNTKASICASLRIPS
jgi:hypothetical protein